MDKTIDWVYTDLIEITAEDIQRRYKCEIEDAQEAMDYVKKFIKSVDEEFESVK
jgi:beta-xylosidase